MLLKQGPGRFLVNISAVMLSPHLQMTFTIPISLSSRRKYIFTSMCLVLPPTVQLWHISTAPLLSTSNIIRISITLKNYYWSVHKGRNGLIYIQYHCSLSFRYFWIKWACQLQQQNTKTSTPSQTTGPPRMNRYDRTLLVNTLIGS